MMTSEEFRKRYRYHPLGGAFQNMEIAETELELERYMSMAAGMILLLKFQGELTEGEAAFLQEAAKGNAKRNYNRLLKTNTPAPKSIQ